MGKPTQKGSIVHYTKVHDRLKAEMKKTAAMNRIRAADTAALAHIRQSTGREALEAKRGKGKRKASDEEEEEEEEYQLSNDLD